MLRDAGHVDAVDAAQPGRDGSSHDATKAAADGGSRVVDGGSDAAALALDASPSDAPNQTTLSLSLALVPPFSTSIHDYYVRCSGPTNTVAVSMTAAPGSRIALEQPVATAPSVQGSAMVSVASGGAIVAVVTAASTSATTGEYWVRCLPGDFAELEMTPHPEAGTPTPGYYLVGDMINGEAIDGGYAMILDEDGVPVWFARTENGDEAVDVDNVIPGTVSFTPFLEDTFAAASAGQFELHDLAAGTTTHVDSVGAPLDLHELRLLPNDDYLIFAAPILTGVDLTGLSTFGASEDMIGCVIQEVDPTGALVWQWDATEHFDPVEDCTYPVVKKVSGVDTVDAFHCNSIDVAPDGDLLVSARGMDSIFLVSKATGEVLWKMGGATYSRDGAPYLAVQGDPETSFYRQHDVRFLPDGTISMFDDQTLMPGPARAVIYSYDVASGTATMVWQYQGTQTSAGMGSFRVLADGSRVIGWGTGAPGLAFTEVDGNGNDLLDFYFPGGRCSYRAVKVPTTAFDIGVLRAATGGP